MQQTIDSLVLSNKLNVGTHWAKKDSTSVQKETNTKDIKAMPVWCVVKFIAMILAIGFVGSWLYIKR